MGSCSCSCFCPALPCRRSAPAMLLPCSAYEILHGGGYWPKKDTMLLPCSCPAFSMLLAYSWPVPTFTSAPAWLQMLPCSYSAPACSYSAPVSYPLRLMPHFCYAPALLLPCSFSCVCVCPDSALVLLCSCPSPALLLFCSCP